jgi:Zn-dependent protease with chaperone function
MDVSGFFDSYPGLFVTQSFLHALIAGVVVEIAIGTWGIRNPSVRQRFFLVVIIFPIFSFAAYHLANPDRNSIYFRLEALFDSGRWLNLDILGVLPLGAVLILVFSLTSLVFLFQELLPIVRHSLASRHNGPSGSPVEDDPRIGRALAPLPGGKPPVFLIEDDEPFIFSTTGRDGSIYLSSGLAGLLTSEQLTAALAHEIAHVARSRRPLLAGVFLLRVVMFFNPVVLMAFRRAVQEDEKICDEIAVSLTGDPRALAETLRRLYLVADGRETREGERGSDLAGDFERMSHRLNIKSRISRLEGKGAIDPDGPGWPALLLTFAVVIALNYFIV